MTGTLAEQLLGAPVGTHVVREVDLVYSHDATTPQAMASLAELFEGTGREPRIRHPDRACVVFDHAYPPPNLQFAQHQQQVRAFIAQQGIPHFFPGEGICHLVIPEHGLVAPRSIVLGADSHTCTLGALGAFATGVGATDVAVAWATGKTWFLVPQTTRVTLEGRFTNGASAKDVCLELARRIGQDGATYHAVEFGGPGWRTLDIAGRFTLANMAVDVGAKTGVGETDRITDAWLSAHGARTGPHLAPGAGAEYAQQISFDLDDVEPLVSGPHALDAVRPARELAGVSLHRVVIGSCTNARIEDLEVAARVLDGGRVRVETLIVPGSRKILQEAIDRGLVTRFHAAGCVVLAPGCGPCLGRHQGVLAPGERCLTTHNRNVPGRMGSPEAEIYLASPAVAAASALAGAIAAPEWRSATGAHGGSRGLLGAAR